MRPCAVLLTQLYRQKRVDRVVRLEALEIGAERSKPFSLIAPVLAPQFCKRLRHSVYSGSIAPIWTLTKQSHRRIPWRVVSSDRPAPVRLVGKQRPDSPAEGAGQVTDHRVDGNDEIKIGDDRSGIHKGTFWGLQVGDPYALVAKDL